MVVRKECLSETPKAFQRYVADWFRYKDVLGIDCMVASGKLHVDHNFYGRRGKAAGVAPTHSVDLQEYKEGLAKDQSLNDWMHKNEGKYVWIFYSSDE
jgi:hypothetical protein